MKFTAIVREYDHFGGDMKEKDIEFNDVAFFEHKNGFFIITLANGDVHATSEQITKYTFTKENN